MERVSNIRPRRQNRLSKDSNLPQWTALKNVKEGIIII